MAEKTRNLSTSPVSSPPRAISGTARRRSWAESTVRLWWIGAATLALLGGYFVISQTIKSARDRSLISDSNMVLAEIWKIQDVLNGKMVGPEQNCVFTLRIVKKGSGKATRVPKASLKRNEVKTDPIPGRPNQKYEDDRNRKLLVFTSGELEGIRREITEYKDGVFHITPDLPQTPSDGDACIVDADWYDVEGRLKDQRKQLASQYTKENSVIPIYVDPNDPEHWTDRQHTQFYQDALAGIMMAPMVAIMFALAIVMRMRVLRVWRDGQAMAVVVVDTRQSALAPLSRVVRFTLRDSRDRRVYHALLPLRAGRPSRGDVLWVVAPPSRPRCAIFAVLYQ